LQGRISKIIENRGFGFIELDEGKDIFFHCSDVEGDFKVLEEGDLVSYEVTEGRDNKDKAIKVHKEI
jgi:CspA family cold shock protein